MKKSLALLVALLATLALMPALAQQELAGAVLDFDQVANQQLYLAIDLRGLDVEGWVRHEDS